MSYTLAEIEAECQKRGQEISRLRAEVEALQKERIYTLADGAEVTGQRAVDLLNDERRNRAADIEERERLRQRAVEENSWIPVGEQMPPEMERVLVAFATGAVRIGFHQDVNGWKEYTNHHGWRTEPTHWRPIPRAPSRAGGWRKENDMSNEPVTCYDQNGNYLGIMSPDSAAIIARLAAENAALRKARDTWEAENKLNCQRAESAERERDEASAMRGEDNRRKNAEYQSLLSDHAALSARCAKLEAVICEAAERCLVEHPANEHKSSSEAIIAVRRFLINAPAAPAATIEEGES